MDHWWVFPVTFALTSIMAVLAFGCGLRLALKDLRRAEDGASETSRGSAVTHALHFVVGDVYVRMLPLGSRGSSLDGPALPATLRAAARPRLPAVELQVRAADAEDSGQACPICLEPLADAKTRLAAGCCRHWMHEPCLRMWLAKDRAQLCPICRTCLTGSAGTPRGSEELPAEDNVIVQSCP